MLFIKLLSVSDGTFQVKEKFARNSIGIICESVL